ncbi:Bromodomain-containing protein isoform 2 [Schistosoma japonicum]|uniref:Bromodomain-containing protein isoform 2 n=1 Tax=Schistosoma japonicum TaxID=6182 RepID=A0A4Z2DKF3_SCHJA|nr:Bromodomain-containing protein isoform 2 [Schistosoma japonicum]
MIIIFYLLHQVISKPMDLGTIFNRLQSRAYYRSAAEYLADVTLMCNNAMIYNPPDTIYYQRARKLLAFCRKQMTISSLQKACKDIPGTLTLEEIGDIVSVESQMNTINRVKPPNRSSKLHTCVERELGDHKLRFSPKHHGDSNCNIPPVVQPLISHSFQSHRGRPKSHLSTTSRLYNLMSRKVLKSYSHVSSEERSCRNDLKRKNNDNNTEKCTPIVEFNKSPSNNANSKEVQIIAHQDTSVLSSVVSTSDVIIPQRRGRGRPRKIRVDNVQTPGSSISNTSAQQIPVSSSLILSNFTVADVKMNLDTLSIQSHDHCSHSVYANNNSFDNSLTAQSNLYMGSVQSDYKIALSESAMKTELTSECIKEFSNSEPIVLLNLAPSTPSSSSPLSGSSCKTFIGKTSTVSKKYQKLSSSDNQSNKFYQFKSDKSKELNDEDSAYNDSCDENLEKSHQIVADNHPNEILIQAKKAAAESAAKLKRKYANISSTMSDHDEYIGPKIICLNCSEQGKISAIECPKARSSTYSQGFNQTNQNNEELLKPQPIYNVSYPPFLVDLLTKSKLVNNQKMDEHLLSKQNKILDDLYKLKCNHDEPLAAAIHGPLTIFSPAQLMQLSDIYGGDPNVIEYAISLLKFAQPIGRWARRWVTKRLDTATDGLHSKACYNLSSQPAHTVKPTLDNEKSNLLQSWTDVIDITIDPPTPKIDESDVEQLEPCLVDLLNQYDTSISCSSHTNNLTLPADNELVSSIPETDISYIRKDHLDSVSTSSSTTPLNVPVSTDSRSLSFCNNDISTSTLVVASLNACNIPQQESSFDEVDSNDDDVIIYEPIPSPLSTLTPNEDVIPPKFDVNNTHQSKQLSPITTKLSEDEIVTITDECATISMSPDDMVPTSNLNEGKLDSVSHTESEEILEAPTSPLETALNVSSSLNTPHDGIHVQSKGISDGSEDDYRNLPSDSGCLNLPTTSLQHILHSHFVTYKGVPVSTTHVENLNPVSQSNAISNRFETTIPKIDSLVSNSHEEVFSDNPVDNNVHYAISDTVDEMSHHSLLSNPVLLDITCKTSEKLTTSDPDISSAS